MSDPKVIYLGPACQEQADGREWCQDDVWEACECGSESVRYVLSCDFDRVTAENAALQQRLTTADERIDDMEAQLADLEQRRHAEQQACQAAERRVGELKLLLTEAIKAWELIQYGDPPVKLAKVMARARAALNPTAEAESQSTGPGYAPRSQSFQTN